jgi:hypothetical protein
MVYVSGKNFSPTQITDFEISHFYCRKPIFGGLLNRHTLSEGHCERMLNRCTLSEGPSVTIMKK